MIEAKIIEDSLSPKGARLTTFQLRYPRYIHAELMTHRQFSRNASSSRAIPISKMIEAVEQDPCVPLIWGKNQRGMQAREMLSDEAAEYAQAAWRGAMIHAVEFSKDLQELGCHKQICNRITEPFQNISVVVTATDWENFFIQRCHEDAEPHFQKLAWKMADLIYGNEPRKIRMGQWHLPYVGLDERLHMPPSQAIKCSVSRCARVSYNNHDGKKPTVEKDLTLYDHLYTSGHMSPFEHQAEPSEHARSRSGNLTGWRQYRKTLKNENKTGFQYIPPEER